MSGWAGLWIGMGIAWAGMCIEDAIKWCVRMMSRADGKAVDSVTFTWKPTEDATDGK